MDSPMVRAAVQRTGSDTLDTPVSDRRFSAAGPASSPGLLSPALRSPTLRSPTVRQQEGEEEDSPVVPQSLIKATHRRRIHSDSEQSEDGRVSPENAEGGESEEDDDFETMPAEADEEEQPKGLRRSVTLYPHQLHGLAWLLWRETQEPRGGILADDMGLGKTLTMISLVVKHREMEMEREAGRGGNKENDWSGGKLASLVKANTTLIICPASLLGQWSGEAESKVKSSHIRFLVYHGAKRKVSARELAKYDLVITTYGTVASEVREALGKDATAKEQKVKMEDMKAERDDDHVRSKESELLNVFWERIILDEAHQVRNPKTAGSLAVCKLRAGRRWCVTGTPIQNKELDLYSLVRFLRFKPWDEYAMWKKWIETNSPQGQERMNLMVKSVLLRRTKDQISKVTGKAIVTLPERHVVEHTEELEEEEMKVFEKVKQFSKASVEKFMEKREEKEMLQQGGGAGFYKAREREEPASGSGGLGDFAYQPGLAAIAGGSDGEIKSHHILVLLLRLRQICNHPGLIKSILAEEEKEADGLEGEADLVSVMEDLGLAGSDKKGIDEILNMQNPVFDLDKVSTKIRVISQEVEKLVKKKQEEGIMEKVVIVSQWTSMLEVIKKHIGRLGVKFCEINGKVPVKDRGDIVQNFNVDGRGAQVRIIELSPFIKLTWS